MRVGLFPGTFDPITMGHLDILERSLMLFDRMIVAVAHQHHKQTIFSVDERVEMFQASLPRTARDRVEVTSFSGLLVSYARQRKVAGVVRGLRFVSDFEYEYQMALMNQKLSPQLTTLFLMPSEKYTYVNSTLIKEIVRHGGSVRGLVPGRVARALAHALRGGSTGSPTRKGPRRKGQAR